jgi:hypothetical protein
VNSDASSTSPTKPRRRWRKAVRVLLFVAACLLTLLVAFYLVEEARGRAAWQAYEAEARARGVKLVQREYLGPPIPDAENFAAIPLFNDTFVTPPPGKPTPNPLALPFKEGAEQPAFDDPAKGKRIDLAAWQKFFVETGVLAAAGDNPASDVLKALQKYEPPLAQLREAGKRPASRFPVRWEDGINALLPHLSVVQNAARIYSLRLATHLATGQREEALQDFRAGLRLYTALLSEPVLISGLVRIHVLTLLENAVWGGLTAGRWSDAELRAIEGDLARLRLMADYQFSMNSERGTFNQILETIRGQSGRQVAQIVGLAAGAPNPIPGSQAVEAASWSLYPRGWLYRSQIRTNLYFDEVLARVSADPPRLDPTRKVHTSPEKKTSALDRTQHLLFYLFAPAVSAVERRYAYSQAFNDQTRIACALERHRLTLGKLPETLDALAPEFLEQLPRDVMTGEPFKYRLLDEGSRFTLYSVGFNQTDDGGKTGGKGNAADQPDWVWQYPDSGAHL